MRILLVEDDDGLADALLAVLTEHGYDVVRAKSVAQARTAPPVDLVLLDLGLPDGDGIEWLRGVREDQQTPVIVVSARAEEHQRVRGLRSGADDYLVKPFGVAELEARINAVMRRTRLRVPRQVRIGNLEVDEARRTAYRGAVEIVLTRKEFDLLVLLIRAGGAVVSREQIMADVWRSTWKGTSRTLEVHVSSLRHKLGAPNLVHTVRSVGYRLCPG